MLIHKWTWTEFSNENDTSGDINSLTINNLVNKNFIAKFDDFIYFSLPSYRFANKNSWKYQQDTNIYKKTYLATNSIIIKMNPYTNFIFNRNNSPETPFNRIVQMPNWNYRNGKNVQRIVKYLMSHMRFVSIVCLA